MEDNEFKVTRSKASGSKNQRNQLERMASPFVGDEGRLEDFYQTEGRIGDAGLNRSGEIGTNKFGETASSRFGEAGPSRFGDAGPSRFGETGPNRFGETGMSRFVETGMGRIADPGFGEQRVTLKADTVADMHIIGQLLGGKDFECKDGLFCEMLLSVGDGWKMENSDDLRFRTQVCYAEPDQMFVWAHPIDLQFSVSDPKGW